MSSENDEWLMKVAAEEAGAAMQPGPYARLNLRNFLHDDSFIDIDERFVNYQKESEALFRIIARHFVQKEETRPTNKVVAVVGQSGSGKTSFVQQLLRKLDKHADQLRPMTEINFMLSFVGKIADTKGIRNMLPARSLSLKRGILFLDDVQYYYYPYTKNAQGNFLKEMLSQISGSVIITTWNVFGWKYVLSLFPDLINLFDEIIWLDGLDQQHMEELIRKRLNKYRLTDDPFNFDKVFDAKGIKLAEQASMRNPRLFIYLVSNAVKMAHQKSAGYIGEEIFKGSIAKLAVAQEVDKLMEDKITYYLLSSPSVMIKELEQFVKMERSTIQKRLKDLVDQKIVRVHEHSEGEPHAKGKYYTLNDVLQVKLEQQLCEEVKAGIHRFRFSKEKGEKV